MVNEGLRSRARFQALPWHQPSATLETALTDARPDNRETETEDQRRPAHDGEPPRPATEPTGSEGSSNSGETATDPSTGEPNG